MIFVAVHEFQVDNFFKLPVPGIELLTLWLHDQHSPRYTMETPLILDLKTKYPLTILNHPRFRIASDIII